MNMERLPDPYQCCLHNKRECSILLQLAFLGAIKKTRNRLTKEEKKHIKPGNVYIYNEKETGIRRWTDDKEWTPSRIQGAFLLYREMNGEFLKKTYSVDLADGKWHLVIYTLMEWEMEGRCCKYFYKNSTVFGNRIPNIRFPKSGIFQPVNIDVKPLREKIKKRNLKENMVEIDDRNRKNSNNLLLNTKLDREIFNRKKSYAYIKETGEEAESSNKDLSIETLSTDMFNKEIEYQYKIEKYNKEDKEKLSHIIFDNNNLDAFNEFVERQINKKQ